MERGGSTLNSVEWPARPRILYRYMPLRRLEDVLRSEFYFSSPESLNDPFDCQLNAKLEGSHADRVNFYNRAMKARHLNRGERRREIKDKSEVLTPELFEEAFAAVRNRANRRGVLCFSEPKADLLMWAHYAESHTGVCLGLDTAAEFYQKVRPVTYSASYPKENLLPFLSEGNPENERATMRFIF
jgi:Protein of unknown function (DUF2971)